MLRFLIWLLKFNSWRLKFKLKSEVLNTQKRRSGSIHQLPCLKCDLLVMACISTYTVHKRYIQFSERKDISNVFSLQLSKAYSTLVSYFPATLALKKFITFPLVATLFKYVKIKPIFFYFLFNELLRDTVSSTSNAYTFFFKIENWKWTNTSEMEYFCKFLSMASLVCTLAFWTFEISWHLKYNGKSEMYQIKFSFIWKRYLRLNNTVCLMPNTFFKLHANLSNRYCAKHSNSILEEFCKK